MKLIDSLKSRRWKLIAVGGALLAAAAVFVSVLAATSGGPSPAFGGGDAGVLAASAAGVSSAPGGSVEVNGVTVRLTGFAADDTRTVVGVAVEGRDDLGEGVLPARGQPTKLLDALGATYYEDGGSADAQNPRLRTIYFPPVPTDTKQLTLVISGMDFVKRSDVANRTPGADVPKSTLNGPWVLTFDVSAQVGKSRSVDVSGAGHALSDSVSVFIDSVSQAATETVINGHLAGLSMDEVPEMLFHGELRAGDGTIGFIGLRLGFGPQWSQFEIRFPRTSGAVSLHLWAEATPHPRDTVANSRLVGKFGSQGTVTVPLNLPD